MSRWLWTLGLLCVACGDDGGSGDDEPAGPADKEQAAEATEYGKADWSFDVCERNGWYGDAECDWYCLKKDPDCELFPLGPEPFGETTKYPIVLAHGFDASPSNRWGFYRVAEALLEDGHDVYVATVPPYNRVSARAGFLQRAVDEALSGSRARKVNLVAHSMGGLDARYLVSTLRYEGKVATLTTISTPHRGAEVADVMLLALPRAGDPLLDKLAEMWGTTYSELASGNTDLRGALTDLSLERSPSFNAENPDSDRVFYQSWAGVTSPFGLVRESDWAACEGKVLRHAGTADRTHLTLLPMAAISGQGLKRIPNDGMTTVASAKWGEFRGCIPADHLDEVGQPQHDGPSKETGFDHVRFYRNLAYDLAERGY